MLLWLFIINVRKLIGLDWFFIILELVIWKYASRLLF